MNRTRRVDKYVASPPISFEYAGIPIVDGWAWIYLVRVIRARLEPSYGLGYHVRQPLLLDVRAGVLQLFG